MNKRFLIILFLITSAHIASLAQTVYFNGLGRALVTADKLNGNILTPDPTKTPARAMDTLSPTRGTGGYTIFDLGINVQPSELLRASVILRMRNEFGGFYGDGSLLQFRQMRLDGVISKSIKYEIGDIDLGLTPYTIYNFDEIYHDYEADVFAIRRSVVEYENFNFDNKWRVQGVQGMANLNFEKGIEKVEFRAFASRTRRTDFLGMPDRILYGGRLGIVQSKFVKVGGNFVNFVDVHNTAASPRENYDAKVVTGDYKIGFNNDKIDVGLVGELGFSKFAYNVNKFEVKNDDSFYDLGVAGEYKPLKLKVFASYRSVGANFVSPAAQTRRIYDYANPSLFPGIENDQTIRPTMIFDRFSDENIRNLTIMPLAEYIPFLPHYNNITPYGRATANRKGITAGASVGDVEKVFKAEVIVDLLDEVTPIGGSDTRKFTGIKGGLLFNLHKLIKFEKAIALNLGIRNEHTQMSGTNTIDLKSTLIDAGLTWEIYKGLDLLAGYKVISAEGNEIYTVKNVYNEVIGYSNINTTLYDYNDLDIKEGVMAFGMRYRFGKNSYFTAQGHFANFVNNNTKSNNYDIRQLFLNYTMIF